MRLHSVIALACLGFAPGCHGPWYDHRFVPSPLEVHVAPRTEAEPGARVLVTVLGIRRPDGGHPAQVEIRLRIENTGTLPVVLEADSLELLASDLTALGVPTVLPDPDPIGTDQMRVYDIAFVLPPGAKPAHYDLGGIHLRWTLAFAGERVGTGITFEQLYRYYYDPYWGPYAPYRTHLSVGVGTGLCG